MLRKAIIVDVHHEDNSVDVVLCDDGSRLAGVPVLSSQGGSARTGHIELPEVPDKNGADKWDITQRNGQDMEALVGFMGRGNPVVVGFLYPQISQMTFQDKRRFSRHRSDVYHTITENGDIELYHPSGVYIRIAENPEHEDLTKKNFDESLELDRNKDRKLWVRVKIPGSGSFEMDPNGNATLAMDKKVTIKGGSGTLVVQDGGVFCSPDATASGVSLKNHLTTGVVSGGDLSGPPQPS